MIYLWTVRLRVRADEIEEPREDGDTWLKLATRDMETMEPPTVEFAEAVVSSSIEFEQGDPSPEEEAKP